MHKEWIHIEVHLSPYQFQVRQRLRYSVSKVSGGFDRKHLLDFLQKLINPFCSRRRLAAGDGNESTQARGLL